MKSEALGVVIGRFQVPELHSGHRHLIDVARKEHARLLIVLGDHGKALSPKHPLSVESRRTMLLEAYPDAQVVSLPDNPSDEVWSDMLDALIEGSGGRNGAVLYGSRDSFIPFYHGRFPTHYVEPVESESGTDARLRALQKRMQESFRHTAVYEHGRELLKSRSSFFSRLRRMLFG